MTKLRRSRELAGRSSSWGDFSSSTLKAGIICTALLTGSNFAAAESDEQKAIEMLDLAFRCPRPISEQIDESGERVKRAWLRNYAGNGLEYRVQTFYTEVTLGETIPILVQDEPIERFVEQRAFMAELASAEADGARLSLTCRGDCIGEWTIDNADEVRRLHSGASARLPTEPSRGPTATYHLCDASTAEVAARILRVFIGARRN